MYSLIRIYLWATSLWVHKCFPITILPYWCFCIEQVYPVPCLVLIYSKPCRHDLTCDLVYPSWSIIQTNGVFDRVWGSFQPRSLYPGRRCPLSTTALQEVVLDSEHLTKLLGQEDRVMKHNKHSSETQLDSTMASCRSFMEGKVAWATEKPFLLSTIPILDILLAIRSMHCSSFLVLPLLS
jgi:hypothetical protein